MNPILNYAKKITIPSQRLQEEKQQIAKKVCGLINESIGKYNQIVGFALGVRMQKIHGYQKKLTLISLLNLIKKHLKRILEALEQKLVLNL